MGVKIAEYDDAIRVQRTGVMRRANVKTMPYPGFPTDMQPQIAVCMSLASGVSVITESIYDTRFGYCAELNRMGASIKVPPQLLGIGRTAALRVKVLDAQQHTPALRPDGKPCEQRGKNIAQMHTPGRAGRKAARHSGISRTRFRSGSPAA